MSDPHVDNTIRQAETLRQQGRVDQAVALLDRLSASHGHSPGVWHHLGITLAVAKRHDDAIAALQRATTVEPDSPEVLNNLGAVLLVAGRPGEAVAPLERALSLRPDYADARKNLANASFRVGDHAAAANDLDAAVAALERAIALKPDHAAAIGRLGNVRRQQGDLDAAIPLLERAAALDPRNPGTLSNLGEALIAAARVDDAVAPLLRALTVAPYDVTARQNLGVARMRQGNSDEALSHFEHAVRLAPDSPRAHMNLGAALLQRGDFSRGWVEFDWRFRLPHWETHAVAQSVPMWRGGEPLAGRTLFLHAEQGFGDAIQFVRYVPIVAERAGPDAKILVGCRPSLRRLFERVPGVGGIVESGQAMPPVDYQCPFMSLPLVLGTTLETIPSRVPYLDPPPETIDAWRTRLANIAGLKVGLAWSGNPSNARDRYRSMQLADLAPLADVRGVTFFALQAVTSPSPLPLTDVTPELTDWAETAGLMMNLDLVLSIDTAAAHLGGALGRPTWLLVSTAAEWRWLIDRTDSPWYPTMRLYRQQKWADWRGVIERVAADLRALART